MKNTLLLYTFLAFSQLNAIDNIPPTTTDLLVADYVIIGSGPAGAPLAKLLSNDRKNSVILIEAGANNNSNPLVQLSTNIPSVAAQRNTQLFWNGPTHTQPIVGRSFDWTTGRVFGGASSINGTFWVRGSNQLYSKWKQFGGKKWSTQRINKIFKYLEKYSGKSSHIHSRGSSGPIDIRQSSQTTPTGKKFSKAVHEALGFPILRDYNDPKTPIGIAPLVQWTQAGKKGKYRVTSTTAFLNDHVIDSTGMGVNKRQLLVLYKTTALTTIWKGNTAIGVRALKSGIPVNIYARKKVIVCAGVNSSKFLLLSGIGPRDVLNALEIPLKFNNRFVGAGLRDNPVVTAVFSVNPQDPATPPKDPNTLAPFYAFFPDPNHPKSRERGVQIVGRISSPGILTVGIILCNPKSRGSVRLQSHDPLERAIIDLNLLSNIEDVETYKRIFRQYIVPIAAKLALIDPTYQLLTPSSTVIAHDALLTTYIKEIVGTQSSAHNYTTHCRMAPFKMGGVVNGMGKVHGVRNLHVADCSIAPTNSDGACAAMAYMIATNIAFQLLEENKHHR